MKKLIYQSAAIFLFVVSFAQVHVASGMLGYQPKVPEGLKK